MTASVETSVENYWSERQEGFVFFYDNFAAVLILAKDEGTED